MKSAEIIIISAALAAMPGAAQADVINKVSVRTGGILGMHVETPCGTVVLGFSGVDLRVSVNTSGTSRTSNPTGIRSLRQTVEAGGLLFEGFDNDCNPISGVVGAGSTDVVGVTTDGTAIDVQMCEDYVNPPAEGLCPRPDLEYETKRVWFRGTYQVPNGPVVVADILMQGLHGSYSHERRVANDGVAIYNELVTVPGMEGSIRFLEHLKKLGGSSDLNANLNVFVHPSPVVSGTLTIDAVEVPLESATDVAIVNVGEHVRNEDGSIPF
jgi:hypothetical protein